MPECLACTTNTLTYLTFNGVHFNWLSMGGPVQLKLYHQLVRVVKGHGSDMGTYAFFTIM